MITVSRLHALLRYNKRTGCFYWRVDRSAVVRKGRRAGSLHKSGYRHIKIDAVIYKEHRLAWLYVKNTHCPRDVEQRNLRKADNRWRNLREADDFLNQANTPRRVDNTSGFKGVSTGQDGMVWRVRIQVRGRRHHLGYFKTPTAAHAAYCKAAKQHFGSFARTA